MEALSKDKQIEIETAFDNGKLSHEQLHTILQGTKVRSCIGGLIEDGKAKDKCGYFKQYPANTKESDLVQHFNLLKSSKQNFPWKAATLLLSLLSLVLGVMIYTKPTDKELANLISDLEGKLSSLSESNIELNNKNESLINENVYLKNENANLLENQTVK